MTKAEPRDDKGRFLKGSGGRAKGSRNKRKTYTPTEFRAHVDGGIDARLKGLLGEAVDVIEGRLAKGDLQAALWLLDSGRGRRTQKLSTIVPDADLGSLQGILATAEQVSQMMLCADLGIGEGTEALANLGRLAQLRGLGELEELKVKIDELTRSSGMVTRLTPEQLPVWGRFREAAEKLEASQS